MKNFLKILVPSAIFLLAIFVVGTNLDKPFWGEHDWNGARYGNIAKNYLRYDLTETKLGQIENGGVVSFKDIIYYTHYQPLLPILISLSFRISGVSEYAARIVPLLATAGLVTVIYIIGSLLVSSRAGIFASLLALATPMIRYYGKNPVHEPLALFFASLSFLGALMLLKGNKKGWALLLVGFILAALTNWSFVFFLPALTILVYQKKHKKQILFLWILGIAMTSLHFLHIRILTGSILGGNLIGALFERTSIGKGTVEFGIIDYILRIRLWSSTLLTNTLLVSSLAGLTLVIRSKTIVTKKFILALFVYSIYPVFFANASFIHSYFIYYFVLPISLLGAYFLETLVKFRKIFLILTVATLIGVWFERTGYLKALNESSGDRLAVEASKEVKDISQPGDTIIVAPFDYAYSRKPILSFYSDRNIVLEGKSAWTVKISGDSYTITKTEEK